MNTVQYSRKAIKGIQKLPADIADQFRTAFQEMLTTVAIGMLKNWQAGKVIVCGLAGIEVFTRLKANRVLVLKLEVGPEVSKNEDTDH
jgi:hypothetical protein